MNYKAVHLTDHDSSASCIAYSMMEWCIYHCKSLPFLKDFSLIWLDITEAFEH